MLRAREHPLVATRSMIEDSIEKNESAIFNLVFETIELGFSLHNYNYVY